ncbi:MAG: beta-ketoacyl reductase, partial [Planctomycetales bacterium]
ALAKNDARLAARIDSIRELENSGARVLVAAVDVAEHADLSSLLNKIHHDGWPPIRGVVHAAGIVDAGQLIDLDIQKLRDILHAKVSGTWLLHKAFEGDQLDFFVNFSSGASLLGSPLLASYAAANSFLDAISHHRRATGHAALAINWGFWDEVGMVARSQREIGRGFAPQGMVSFSPQQGLAALQHLLEIGAVQTAVMPADWPEWWRYHPRAAQSSLFADLVQLEMDEVGDQEQVLESADEEPGITREIVLQAPAANRAQIIEEYLSNQLSRVLRIPAEELDIQQPLNNLGIDSLMAVELRNHVQANLGVIIPVAQLMQDPSISQLATVLLNDISSAAPVAGSLAPTASNNGGQDLVGPKTVERSAEQT